VLLLAPLTVVTSWQSIIKSLLSSPPGVLVGVSLSAFNVLVDLLTFTNTNTNIAGTETILQLQLQLQLHSSQPVDNPDVHDARQAVRIYDIIEVYVQCQYKEPLAKLHFSALYLQSLNCSQ